MKLLDYMQKKKTFIIAEMSGNHGGKIEKAIEANRAYHSDDLFDEIMIKREMRVLELIKASGIV